MEKTKIDGITIEVLRNAFQSIAEEMGITLIRTSLSPNIKDRMDASTAIYTKEGKLISQAEHIPLHLGLMPSVVEEVLKIHPVETLKEGDTIIINDPFISGSHLPDIFLISPVFYEGEIVAIVANIAHHVDVGGMVPGSCSNNATEIFQEGLRIPPIFLSKENKLNQDFLRLFTANSRAKEVLGDLYAQLGANQVGIKRLKELYDRYTVEYVNLCVEEIMDYSKRRMRTAIQRIENGCYEYEDYLEGNGNDDNLIRIKVKVEIKDEEVCLDFKETDKQSNGPVNSTIGVTKACSYFAIKSLFEPDIPPNAGSYELIKVIAPKGLVVNPKFPAAVSNGNANTSQRIVDTIFGALAKALPERSMAACSGSMNAITIGGFDEEKEEYFSYIETIGGGQGASLGFDGMNGVHTNMTNTKNTPVEAIEQKYPFSIERYQLADDTGGNGQFKGGMGIIREIIFTCDHAVVSLTMERRKFAPWGLFGGSKGGTSKCTLTKFQTKEKLELPVKSTFEVKKGDKLYIQTSGGGGYGVSQQVKS